ncbi:MAG: hypothetical protein RLN88_14505 [Ekhidna sp.]|uniref:hypothetical protein n=1 Tax=Ekhidna sp. TaxID=2608089 RepID=UPI0032EBAF6B
MINNNTIRAINKLGFENVTATHYWISFRKSYSFYGQYLYLTYRHDTGFEFEGVLAKFLKVASINQEDLKEWQRLELGFDVAKAFENNFAA